MCFRHSGLHCVTINGWAKGITYCPGDNITQEEVNHSWNAVFINGDWQLIDVQWANQCHIQQENGVVYDFDEFYFLANPAHLIYTHLPRNSDWQLLRPAVAAWNYEHFPIVQSFFFDAGMEFLQQSQGDIQVQNGVHTITLGLQQPLTFNFKLLYGKNRDEVVHGMKLSQYVMQETTENRVTFYFRAPCQGTFTLVVYAMPVGDDIFTTACEYTLIVNDAVQDIEPFPKCSGEDWGPGSGLIDYGIVPSHKQAILKTVNGQAQLMFQQDKSVNLYAQLKRSGFDEDALEKCVVSRKTAKDKFCVKLNLENPGEYGLELYANTPADGDSFTLVCQYLVTFTDQDLGAMYGKVFDRQDIAYSLQASQQQANRGVRRSCLPQSRVQVFNASSHNVSSMPVHSPTSELPPPPSPSQLPSPTPPSQLPSPPPPPPPPAVLRASFTNNPNPILSQHKVKVLPTFAPGKAPSMNKNKTTTAAATPAPTAPVSTASASIPAPPPPPPVQAPSRAVEKKSAPGKKVDNGDVASKKKQQPPTLPKPGMLKSISCHLLNY